MEHHQDAGQAEQQLRQFIAQESEQLRGTLRLYIARAGLNSDTDDLLSEVVAEALASAAHFDVQRSPFAWMLGIAANLIRRKTVQRAKLERREPLIRDLYPDDEMSDDELFDRFAANDSIEEDDQIMALLTRVSSADREVLQLAHIQGLDGESLARALNITPGAARVRLHRALEKEEGYE